MDRRTAGTEWSVRESLGRIALKNADLAAFVHVRASEAEAEAGGLGPAASAPLAGMPVAVKDIIDVEGLPTGAGSLTRRGVPPATSDAHVVRKLRQAGAIVVGKTHTVEFAFGGWGTNVTVGTPKNPWDLAVHRVPGGSSSGTGVAVGGGLVPAGLGTDTGGSVRIPAAMCGCVGLKTSLGLVGRSGVVPLSQTLDSVGPLARDVTTAAMLFSVMQGFDPNDRSTAGMPYVDALSGLERGLDGLRIGVLPPETLKLTSPEVRAHVADAVAKLKSAGATVSPLTLPDTVEAYTRASGFIMAPEGYANHAEHADPDATTMAPPIRARMLAGKATGAADYFRVMEARPAAIAKLHDAMDRIDAFVLPTCPIAAIPVADVDEGQATLAAYTRFVNYLDLAALAVPIGFTQDGLPTSLQIVVRKYDDALALRIGRAFEKVRGAFPAPPA